MTTKTKTSGEPGETNIGGAAIDTMIRIAQQAKRTEIVLIDTTGLGEGLPAKVPLLFSPAHDDYASIKKLIEEHRLGPERRKGTAKADTLDSFIALVNRHKDIKSALFARAQWPNPALTAVINYHGVASGAGAADTRHCDHRIAYTFHVTKELTAWVSQDGKTMKQELFALFLEEHAAELATVDSVERSAYEPLFKERFADPNELIALSRSLEVFVGAKVKNSHRLASGERVLEFVVEHTDGATGGKVDIPGIFMVSLKAFEQSDQPVRIPARLRYRLNGGEITWFYQLYRWEQFLSDRVREDLKIAETETALPAFEGEPEK